MLDSEKFKKFNGVLMLMSHDVKSQNWLLRHSISQDILDEMVSSGYLIFYEKDDDGYYMPTEKSKEIW